MTVTRKDLLHTLRELRRAPGYSLTVILTLALGVGLNTAIFTVVDNVLLRPLGYRDANRLVLLQTHFSRQNRSIPRMGGDDYNDVAADVHSLESAAYYGSDMGGVSLEGHALYLPLALVSPRFGEVLGVQPVAGRLFRATDTAGQEVLISQALADQQFGSAGAALGHSMRLEGTLRPIVGVLPAGFGFPDGSSVWVEATARPETANRTAYNQSVIGKLRPGVTLPKLNEELRVFSAHLAASYPENLDKTLEAVSLQEGIVGGIRSTLYLLMAAVAVVLLIVWANITHLQLVRATRQRHVLSIRTALGASRSTLAFRALLEAMVLGALGCVTAVLLAVPALRLLLRLAPPSMPRLNDIHLNWQVLFFSAVLSLLLMGLTAWLPVWRSWQIQPGMALRQESSRTSEGRGTRQLRNSFLVAQVSLTLTLFVVALLLTRKLVAEGKQELGFAPDHLLVLDAHALQSTPPPAEPEHPTPAELQTFQAQQTAAWSQRNARLQATLDSVAAIPGVTSVSAVRGAPMGFGGPDVDYAVRGKQVFAPPFRDLPNAEIRPVTPSYFASMHIPVHRGRSLSPEDRLGSPWVVVIDEATARQSFPGVDPLGKQIICGLSAEQNWMTIVGVVGDVRLDSPGARVKAVLYVPVAQYPWAAGDLQIMVRTGADPAAMMHTLQARLKQAHPELALKLSTMRENIAATQTEDRFRDLLFGSFAAVSLLLAAVGIYGITAYSATQRNFEFGLRFALGAGRLQILSIVLRSALATVGAGILLGFALSLAATHVLAGVVGGLPLFDTPAYLLAAALVLLLACVAALLPAGRAARTDPLRVLRAQ